MSFSHVCWHILINLSIVTQVSYIVDTHLVRWNHHHHHHTMFRFNSMPVCNYAYLDPSLLSYRLLTEIKHVCGKYTVIVIKWLGIVSVYLHKWLGCYFKTILISYQTTQHLPTIIISVLWNKYTTSRTFMPVPWHKKKL